MLFPSPGNVLSTLHGQGHVVASGVRFLMGPSQRESHRLWSGRSLQRDVADTQRLQPRMHHSRKMRHTWSKKCMRSLEKEKVERPREKQRKTYRCSLTQSLPSMISQMKGFNFLQHFSKATDVLFMADVSWPWLGYDTHWLARLHPFSKPNSCEVSRPFLHHIAHLTVIHLYTGQCLSLDFVVHSARLLLDANLNCLSPIFNSQ